jgi:epoxyqueuosine reductase QueG
MTLKAFNKDAAEETRRLKTFATSLGADLVGVADLGLYRDEYGFSKHLLGKFPYAVSLAVRLSNTVIDGITEEDPTEIYVHHYKTVNILLDSIALRVANYCQAKGYDAMPISASQVLDEERLLGAVSHKAIAVLAGLGWQGKSLLVINENFGPRMRLVSVLTTLPLIPDKPVENRCGDCTACVRVCPENAIKGASFQEYALSREEALDVQACNRRLLKIANNPRYGVRLCGICIKACPWGRKT